MLPIRKRVDVGELRAGDVGDARHPTPLRVAVAQEGQRARGAM